MLPWKKHKFELLAEAPPRQASKPKGYAVSLHYSALSSLARACPEGALSRVGSMFRSKRKKLHITSEDPTYTVLYLGNATSEEEEEDGVGDGDPAEEEAEAQRALVVAMQLECEDLLDPLENGHEEALGDGGVSLGPSSGTSLPLSVCASDMKAQLSQLISDLGDLSFGNDVSTLETDLRVTRLLSGESTGSESSIEGGGLDATPVSPGNPSGPADSTSLDEPYSG